MIVADHSPYSTLGLLGVWALLTGLSTAVVVLLMGERDAHRGDARTVVYRRMARVYLPAVSLWAGAAWLGSLVALLLLGKMVTAVVPFTGDGSGVPRGSGHAAVDPTSPVALIVVANLVLFMFTWGRRLYRQGLASSMTPPRPSRAAPPPPPAPRGERAASDGLNAR